MLGKDHLVDKEGNKMITIRRIGIESDIELKTVNNMEFSMKPNQHVQMVKGYSYIQNDFL